ncbi:MAG: FAD-dependent oxidoreductase [Pseudomonadota bacterium]
MSATVAIVGSGPSGCYLAQALRKLLPEAELTVIDRLPVPYGLVRYGVAPDHQGTKAVTRQFARLFERDGVEFIGNVHVGSDVSLAELEEMFDAVVLATGLSADRPLAAFEGVGGVYGSGDVTRAWNGHPDDAKAGFAFGEAVVVVGNGNVAMDVVRLLAKDAGEFEGSDITGDMLGGTVRQIHLLGRSGAEAAKFDATMVRELGKIEGLAIDMAQPLPEGEAKVLADLHALNGKAGDGKRLTFHFNTAPVGPVMKDGRLAGVTCRRDGDEVTLACDSVVTAIGFDARDVAWRDALLARAIDVGQGRLTERLYATGWFRRGPTGTIADNRGDAKLVAAAIAGHLQPGGRPGRLALQQKIGHQTTSYRDWQRIDEWERNSAPPNRVRAKMTSKAEMLALCAEGLSE